METEKIAKLRAEYVRMADAQALRPCGHCEARSRALYVRALALYKAANARTVTGQETNKRENKIMRTESRIIYTAAELKKEKPEAFEEAFYHYRDNLGNAAWSDEICQSGRATVEAAGLRLKEWSVDQTSPGQSYYRLEEFDGEDLRGRKAREWLRRAFGPKVKINFRGREPGNCPFTGYCADDDCIDALKKSIRDGGTLKEAFENLAYVVAKICESESEYEATEAYFLDHADANGWEYDEHGGRI